MSKQYELTKQIIEIIPQINKKFGLDIRVESEYSFSSYKDENDYLKVESWRCKNKEEYDSFPELKEKQIRQILVGLREVLKKDSMHLKIEGKDLIRAEFSKKSATIKANTYQTIIESEAETLYKKWCYGFPVSLFTTNPDKVLEELVEVLESLIKGS